jgi:uncharacterized membrane protein
VPIVAAAAWLAYRVYAEPIVPLPRQRRLVLGGLRVATLLLLVGFLLRPMLVEPASELRDAVVPVLVDGSRSMRLADVDGRARIDHASTLLRERLLPRLDGEFQVELLAFGEELTEADPLALTADTRRSDLTGALRAAQDRYSGRTVAGIVVLSDGGDTTGREAADALAPGGAPIYPIGLGARRIARDREVVSISVGEAPLVGSMVDLSVSAVSHGYETEPVELRLLENGQPIQVRRVAPPGDGTPFRETFQVSPRRDAATLYTVEIPTDPAELAAENNRRSVLVQPPGRPRRVLLVEGAPGFEHSFLKRALARDAGIELDSVVRKGQNERGQDTFYVQAAASRAAALSGGYPVTRGALFAYDAIVFGNIEADFFTREQLAMTADFVAQRGGGLLVLGARSFASGGIQRTVLHDALPLDLADRGGTPVRAAATLREPNRLALTADGEVHPVMQLGPAEESRRRWLAAPPLASTSRLGAPRPGASILAVTSGAGGALPLVAIQRYGEGRSMVFAGEASWRWRMLLPAEDRTHELFWRQAIRWLAAGSPDPVAVVADPAAAPDEPAALEVIVRDAAFAPVADALVSLRVTAPGGGTTELQGALVQASSGRYAAQFRPETTGVHRISANVQRPTGSVSRTDTWMLVGGSDPEFADPRLHEEVLRRVALASGGRVIATDEIELLAAELAAAAPELAPPAHRDVWHGPWPFFLLVGLLTAEWGLRRQWGLR